MENLKISIITCVYNSEAYLQKNIDSVRSQSYMNYEQIFIDAFSKDKTVEIIKKYKDERPGAVFIFQQDPSGISNAMNLGVEKATGDIICHLHSDDLFFDKNTLNYVSNAFVENDIEWCYGNLEIIDEKDCIYNREEPPEFNYGLLRSRNFIPHPATFMRRDFFLSLGGFNNYKYAMDYDLWLRASKLSEPFKINHYLAKFRRHSQSLSTSQYINTLKEDYAIRSLATNNGVDRFIDWLSLQYKVVKYKVSKLVRKSR